MLYTKSIYLKSNILFLGWQMIGNQIVGNLEKRLTEPVMERMYRSIVPASNIGYYPAMKRYEEKPVYSKEYDYTMDRIWWA